MRRALLIALLAALMVVAMVASAAFAGEWNPGHFNKPGGDLPAKYHANSECLFNGLDEPDETSLGAGDGEPLHLVEVAPDVFEPVGDDGDWGNTPARGKVQSVGQLVAAGFVPPGIPGEACNGHLNPLK